MAKVEDIRAIKVHDDPDTNAVYVLAAVADMLAFDRRLTWGPDPEGENEVYLSLVCQMEDIMLDVLLEHGMFDAPFHQARQEILSLCQHIKRGNRPRSIQEV